MGVIDTLFEMRFANGLKKAFTMSYDDGVDTDARLIEIMKKHGLYGSFNINAGVFAKEGTVYPPEWTRRRMTKSQAVALYKNSGMEIACHGYSHCFLDRLPVGDCETEILRDRAELEALFDTITTGMAYPNGKTSESVIPALKAAGIVYCRTVDSTHDFRIPENFHKLTTTCRHKDEKLFELCDRFVSDDPKREAEIFSVWGHSYEFEENGDWDRIEEFAERISGKKDIWYATFSDILGYIADHRKLEFDVRLEKAHNPTARDLWLQKGADIFLVPSGQTVSLK